MPKLSLNGKKIHYLDQGHGYPVVFAHSFLWDSRMWEPQFNELSKFYRCIAIDLWDHGQSDNLPSTPYSIEKMAKDYWGISQILNLEKFAFIGLSVGGMIGAHLVLNHPEAVDALVLMGTYVGEEPEESRQTFAKLLDYCAAAGEFTPDLLDLIIPQELRSHLAAVPKENIPGIVTLGRSILCQRKSILHRLPEIKIPTLVAVGEQDISRPPHESQQMANLIPGAELAIVKNAGHICNLEQPEVVTKSLSLFLAGSLTLMSELKSKSFNPST